MELCMENMTKCSAFTVLIDPARRRVVVLNAQLLEVGPGHGDDRKPS